MSDETGTEATRSDAPSADESLFGETAGDTEVAVADEQDANEETAQDLQGPDVAEEEAGQPEDLKVVVSIKGGKGHHRGATALVGPAHRDLRRPGPGRAHAGGLGGDRTGESQVGGRTQASGSRETRSPGQASAPAWAGVRRRPGPPREGRTSSNRRR